MCTDLSSVALFFIQGGSTGPLQGWEAIPAKWETPHRAGVVGAMGHPAGGGGQTALERDVQNTGMCWEEAFTLCAWVIPEIPHPQSRAELQAFAFLFLNETHKEFP